MAGVGGLDRLLQRQFAGFVAIAEAQTVATSASNQKLDTLFPELITSLKNSGELGSVLWVGLNGGTVDAALHWGGATTVSPLVFPAGAVEPTVYGPFLLPTYKSGVAYVRVPVGASLILQPFAQGFA